MDAEFISKILKDMIETQKACSDYLSEYNLKKNNIKIFSELINDKMAKLESYTLEWDYTEGFYDGLPFAMYHLKSILEEKPDQDDPSLLATIKCVNDSYHEYIINMILNHLL